MYKKHYFSPRITFAEKNLHKNTIQNILPPNIVPTLSFKLINPETN